MTGDELGTAADRELFAELVETGPSESTLMRDIAAFTAIVLRPGMVVGGASVAMEGTSIYHTAISCALFLSAAIWRP